MELKFKLHLIVVLTLAVLLPGCYAHRKTVEGSKPNADKIEWPDNYRPKDAGFFVRPGGEPPPQARAESEPRQGLPVARAGPESI